MSVDFEGSTYREYIFKSQNSNIFNNTRLLVFGTVNKLDITECDKKEVMDFCLKHRMAIEVNTKINVNKSEEDFDFNMAVKEAKCIIIFKLSEMYDLCEFSQLIFQLEDLIDVLYEMKNETPEIMNALKGGVQN